MQLKNAKTMNDNQINPKKHRIAIIVFDELNPFHLSVPNLVFGQVNQSLGWEYYEIVYCAEHLGAVQTQAGFDLRINQSFEVINTADSVIVPSWGEPSQPPSDLCIRVLQAADARGTRIIGLCLGAFVLAYAGLLDHKAATTHWAWMACLAEQFPLVDVRADVLYVHSQNIVTSAGTAAAIDCCLDLIRKDHGAQLANHIARYLVTAPHRQGGQAQYIEQPLAHFDRKDRFTDSLKWMLEHIDQPHQLESVAEYTHMSIRSYSRQFKRQTGCTLKQWLIHQRLQRAQQLLECQNISIEHVAEQVGFSSATTFRQQFIKAFSISPRQYRKQFHL